MTCQESRIQAYLDGELTREDRKELARHIEHCQPCHKTLIELKRLSEWTDLALHEALAPLPNEQQLHLDVDAAWATFESKLQARREGKTVAVVPQPLQAPTKIVTGRWSVMANTYKKWIAGSAAAVVVAGALMIPQVQAATGDLLHLFRVEKFQLISINPSDLQDIQSFFEKGKIGEKDLAGLGKVEMIGDKNATSVHYKSAAEAKQKGVALPVTPNGYTLTDVNVTPSRTMKFTVDVKKMNALLTNFGSTVTFDENLDNKPFSVTMPQDVETNFHSTATPGVNVSYGVSATPNLQVPHDVDVVKLRATILSLPFLPDHIKQQLASIQDWQTTMPIPTFEGQGTIKTEKVSLNGTEAIYTTAGSDNGMLVWQKSGRMYHLTVKDWNANAGDMKQFLVNSAAQFN
ncbi:MAG: zf-HC2 domain-containing protein [Tumebacillaceae bacterium]